MLREELLHPALSHFPIALLILASFTKMSYIITLEKSLQNKEKLLFTHRLLLFTGSAMLLPVIFLGDMAFDIIKEDLCNIVHAYQHEELGQITLSIYIIALIPELLDASEKLNKIPPRYIHYTGLLLLILGNIFLFQAAHSGANLVYQQGAGVNISRDYKCQD